LLKIDVKFPSIENGKFRRDGDIHFDVQCALVSDLEGCIFSEGTVMPTLECALIILQCGRMHNYIPTFTTDISARRNLL